MHSNLDAVINIFGGVLFNLHLPTCIKMMHIPGLWDETESKPQSYLSHAKLQVIDFPGGKTAGNQLWIWQHGVFMYTCQRSHSVTFFQEKKKGKKKV